MAGMNDSTMIHDPVDEFVNGLDGHIHSDIEGLPAIFLDDKPWSVPAITIAKEIAASHRLIIKSYNDFGSWIKNVENAARPYRILEDNAPRRMWLEQTLGKSLVLTNGASANWSSALVLGEIGIDCSYMVGFRNLCAHADEVFAHQTARIIVHGFYIFEGILEMWVFDRAGIYGSQAFNIQETPDLVTQIIASYLLMDDSSLGISHLIKHDDRGNYIEGKFGGPASTCRLYLDDSPIFARVNNSVISDGLTCYRARLQTLDGWGYAVKLKWCEPDEGSEAEMLGLATEKRVWGVTRLIEHRDVCSTSEWRHALNICSACNVSDRTHPHGRFSPSSDSGHTTESPREGANLKHTSPIKEKMLEWVVVTPVGKSLHRFESIPEVLYALRDALKGHRSLYQDAGILHRDIAPGNIIIPAYITDHNPQDPKGVLIDLDLALPVTSPSKQFESIGTSPFQAIGVLQAYLPNNPHTYRHDLESFFYTFIFIAICKEPVPAGENQLQLPKTSLLQRWTQGRPVDKARAKTEDMNAESFRLILAEFTPDFKVLSDLAEQLRTLLFPIRDGKLWTGTDRTAEGTAALYNGMIQGFDKAAEIILSKFKWV